MPVTQTEQIQVYLYTKIADTFGGFIPGTPILKTDAPLWATIENSSGNDSESSRRKVTDNEYTVTVNATFNAFKWQNNFFITTRFGNLDITGIRESVRKRQFILNCILIEGASSSSGGQLMTVYKRATYGTTSLEIEEIADARVLLTFREGIGKEAVEDTPTNPNQIKVDGPTLSLFEGDIFGDELITVLYVSN